MMSNDAETLINKYRPTKWDDVIGQDALIRSLKTSVQNRESRTYLLSGPSGTGKTTIARIISTAVGCANPIEVDAATNNGVDDMRVLVETLKYRPILEDDIKVIIVDECHMATKAAWNSLLKSVEEPPAWVIWVFCTTDVSKVIDTIKTRSTHGQLKSVNQDDLYNLLCTICESEGFAATHDDVLDACAKEASGSPRQAISNLAICHTAQSRSEALSLLRSAIEDKEPIDLIKALINGDPWEKLQAILSQMTDANPESVRQAIRGYLTKVILGAKDKDRAFKLFKMLDCFDTPCLERDGLTPIILSVGRVLFSG